MLKTTVKEFYRLQWDISNNIDAIPIGHEINVLSAEARSHAKILQLSGRKSFKMFMRDC